MSDNYKTKEEMRAEFQARLDAHFAEIGATGFDSGRTLVPGERSDRMAYNGRTYEFRLDENGSYVCSNPSE